jgi:hypothetical protein
MNADIVIERFVSPEILFYTHSIFFSFSQNTAQMSNPLIRVVVGI